MKSEQQKSEKDLAGSNDTYANDILEYQIRTNVISLLFEKFSDYDPLDIYELEKTIFSIANEYDNNAFEIVYMNRVRCMIANATVNKYINNRYILSGLGDGSIKLKDIPKMSPHELNPDQWSDITSEIEYKKLREKLRRESEVSSIYTCWKCKQNRTTHKDIQTRSSDEGCTVFILCLNCGNMWRLYN